MSYVIINNLTELRLKSLKGYFSWRSPNSRPVESLAYIRSHSSSFLKSWSIRFWASDQNGFCVIWQSRGGGGGSLWSEHQRLMMPVTHAHWSKITVVVFISKAPVVQICSGTAGLRSAQTCFFLSCTCFPGPVHRKLSNVFKETGYQSET